MTEGVSIGSTPRRQPHEQQEGACRFTHHASSEGAVPVTYQGVCYHEGDRVRVSPASCFHGYRQVRQGHLVVSYTDLWEHTKAAVGQPARGNIHGKLNVRRHTSSPTPQT